MSNDAVKRGVDPYADADWVKNKLISSAKERINFSIAQTPLLAGTSAELVATADGYITGLFTSVTTGVTTGGAVTVEVNGTAVAGLSVAVADGSSVGDVDSDTIDHGVPTARVRAGDRIEVIPAADFATAGALTGTLVIDLD